MTENYTMALAEVYCILQYTDEELVKRVPAKFIEFIKRSKSKRYEPTINPEQPLANQKLLPETKAVISLMYRKYWCTPEEREKLESKDRQVVKNIAVNKVLEDPVKKGIELLREIEPVKGNVGIAKIEKELSLFEKIKSFIRRLFK